MTREQFVREVRDFYDLKEFCYENDISTMDGVFCHDDLDDYIREEIDCFLRDDWGWREIMDYLRNVDDDYEWYDTYDGLEGLSNDSFDEYKQMVIDQMDDDDAWDEDDEADEEDDCTEDITTTRQSEEPQEDSVKMEDLITLIGGA